LHEAEGGHRFQPIYAFRLLHTQTTTVSAPSLSFRPSAARGEISIRKQLRYYIYNEEVLEEDSIQNWMLSTEEYTDFEMRLRPSWARCHGRLGKVS
ncbi:MAG: hypothetical protein J6Y27_08490, partial [Bacteroidales bacterium]|nr:hypothetical protein [Bacteroidales bacterium]